MGDTGDIHHVDVVSRVGIALLNAVVRVGHTLLAHQSGSLLALRVPGPRRWKYNSPDGDGVAFLWATTTT